MDRYLNMCIAFFRANRVAAGISAIVLVVLVAGTASYYLRSSPAPIKAPDVSTNDTADLQPLDASSGDYMASESGSYCDRALQRAKNFGTLPGHAALTDTASVQPDGTGTMACVAKADEATYTVTIDKLCAEESNSECLRIHQVKQDDGTVLFERAD